MKILDITHFYSERSGGIKTYINQKISYFKDKNIEHVVIVPGKKDHISYVNNTKIYQIKSPYMLIWKQYRILINQTKISDIIEYEKPDIVEVGSLFLLPTFIKKLKDKMGFSIVGFFHSNLEKSISNLLHLKKDSTFILKAARQYIYKTYKDMDLVIAPSFYVKNYLSSIGLYNAHVIHHGLDLSDFEDPYPAEELKNSLKDKFVLIYAGRFSKDKNFLELLKIFRELKNIDDKFHLLLVGDGPDKKKTKKYLDSNYTLLDYVKDKRYLANLYASSDAFISASKSDTFGYALIEAQACGLPIVAYKDNSFPEIVYYKDFLASSKEDFIAKTIFLSQIYDTLDKNKIKHFIKKHFSIEKNMEKLLTTYSHLIHSNKFHQYLG